MTENRCALVVPCFNESRRLRTDDFIRFLKTAPDGFRLVFVDDGSSDSTLQVLQGVQREAPSTVVILPKKPNAGKAEAVRYGMNYAIEALRPEVTGFWDADLATPLPEVYELLNVFKDRAHVEMVFGARVNLLGRRIVRKPYRHYLGRVFATVVSNILALPVYDTQCGAKLFRATADLKQVLAQPFLSRWIFDVEIIARFIRLRGVDYVQDAIYEYPLRHWEDIAGSRLKPADFVRAVIEIVRIRNSNLRQKH